MQYRRLGRSGVKVSEIALGSWLTYGGSVDAAKSEEIIDRAYALGINFFDTANVYARGAAEEIMGKALRKYPRDSYVLATKVFFPMGDGPNDRGLSRKHIMEQCEASLKRLGVDYIDLYQCHRFDPETPLDETLRALDDLVRQGKVLYVGVSQWTAAQIAEALHIADKRGFDRIVSNQPYYNMLGREIEQGNRAAVQPRRRRPDRLFAACARRADWQIQARRSDSARFPRRGRQVEYVDQTSADRGKPRQG